VGSDLIRLIPAERPFLVLGRNPPPSAPSSWKPFDPIHGDLGTAAPEARVLLHLAPLPLLPGLLGRRLPPGINRIVALGSTSSRFKRDSGSGRERRIAQEQIEAEAAIAEWAERMRVAWTLLRPTLTYGARDRNITRILSFIRRFRFFPVTGGGLGLRQPLDASDLAKGCLAVLDNPKTYGRSYDLGGGETLTYRAMVERVFAVVGRTPRIVNVPRSVARAGLRVMAHHPRWPFIDPEMADRMSADLVVDNAPAQDDFAFAPGPFRPERCLEGARSHV